MLDLDSNVNRYTPAHYILNITNGVAKGEAGCVLGQGE